MDCLRSRTRQRGASLGIVAAIAFLIVIVIIAGFQLMVYLGGSRELRHSVDAAVLNVSKRATENKTNCGLDTGYDDVADSTGKVGLTNINRVWGKAFLINANAENMLQNGYSSGNTNPNAIAAYSNAQILNDKIFDLLSNKAASDVHFTQIAQNKPARLLQGGSEIYTDKQSKWAVGWIYRGEESNIAVDKTAIPAGITPNYLEDKANNVYLQGFNPMQANSRKFCFTTFHANEAPHLITDNAFAQAKTAVSGAINPIPNAFQESGQIKNSQVPLTSLASAVANPMRGYKLAIPHSYVTVSIINNATWIVQGNLYANAVYYPGEGTVWKVKSYKIKKPGQGIENGYVSLGNEYVPNNVWHAIHDALPGDHTVVVTSLLQRIKEFCPGYTAQQLQQLLSSTQYGPAETEFYIYPVYKQPDLTDPIVVAASATSQLPNWLARVQPDGAARQIMQEEPVSGPNYCWSDIRKGTYKTDKHWTEESGTISWMPGTGWNQNLGSLIVQRNTTITFTALP